MMRHFLDIAFRGASFHGWQRQPGDISVQECLEDAFSKALRSEIAVTGAGRTDAGVNARRMVAHVDLPEEVEIPSLLRAVNAMAGKDVAVRSAVPVHADAHARFDATSRTYRYFAHTSKNPFVRELSWQASPALDFDAMNEAAALLLGKRDFTSFAKLHSDARTNICDLRIARWVKMDQDRWYFEICADRFLRNMVRAVVGTLVEVGRGKIKPQGIMEILEASDRCAAGTSMPAHALFLW
ncbi:MAG: tRNA pseudouridine(38-40) synthase TruA, partial [Muribaculaceae bacterium]|nr:tRNA pseudouridine(38-40) synthase TruA [Muribaculaceae bacterium]